MSNFLAQLTQGLKQFADISVGSTNIISPLAVRVTATTPITVTFNFYTKNADETGDGDPIDEEGVGNYALAISDTDTAIKQLVIKSTTDTVNVEGFEELVRIKASVSAGGDDNWLLGRMFPPVWFDEAS